MSTKLELSNNKKPLIRRIHKHGNYFSVGLPQSIKSLMKVDDEDYFRVWFDAENNAIIYKKLESERI